MPVPEPLLVPLVHRDPQVPFPHPQPRSVVGDMLLCMWLPLTQANCRFSAIFVAVTLAAGVVTSSPQLEHHVDRAVWRQWRARHGVEIGPTGRADPHSVGPRSVGETPVGSEVGLGPVIRHPPLFNDLFRIVVSNGSVTSADVECPSGNGADWVDFADFNGYASVLGCGFAWGEACVSLLGTLGSIPLAAQLWALGPGCPAQLLVVRRQSAVFADDPTGPISVGTGFSTSWPPTSRLEGLWCT